MNNIVRDQQEEQREHLEKLAIKSDENKKVVLRNAVFRIEENARQYGAQDRKKTGGIENKQSVKVRDEEGEV